jgi:hypothetical protein
LEVLEFKLAVKLVVMGLPHGLLVIQ